MQCHQGWLRVEQARRAEPRVEFERVERAILLTNTPSSESSRASCSRLEFEQGSSLDSKPRAEAWLMLDSLDSLKIARDINSIQKLHKRNWSVAYKIT